VSANSVQLVLGSGGFGLPAQSRTTPASYGGDPPPLSGAGIALSAEASGGGATGASSPPSTRVVASDTGGLGASDTGGLGASDTGGLGASVPAAPLSFGGGGVVASDPEPPDPPLLVASPVGAASEHAAAQVSNPKERAVVIERARIIVVPSRRARSIQ